MKVLDEDLANNNQIVDNSIWPFVYRYAMIGAIVLSIARTLEFTLFDNDEQGYITIGLGIVIFLSYIVSMLFGVIRYKKSNEGFLTFRQGFVITYLIGCIVSLVNFLITVALVFLLKDLSEFGYLGQLFGLSEADSSTPSVIIITFFLVNLMSCIAGLLVSLIIGASLQKRRSIGFNAA